MSRCRRIVTWSLLLAILATGGTAAFCLRNYIVLLSPPVPNDPTTAPIEGKEIRAHVDFLAHRSLKGRKPLSMGSRIARQYICSRFGELGLVPWGDADGFEQPIRLGTNIVGVLPARNTPVTGDVILICAHYDHLGAPYLGAADNASGVATLIEIAEHLTLSGLEPRRSVCFAAFDNEEMGLFGSTAFRCREDFDARRISAVVNLDVLGRAFLDVSPRTVVVAGTEGYPVLRQEIQASAAREGLDVLPFRSDLLGPRSDHFTFADLGVPCLFFTTGPYSDYHMPSDTSEKVDETKVAAAARFLAETTAWLAGLDIIASALSTEPDREEIVALNEMLQILRQSPIYAGAPLALRTEVATFGASIVHTLELERIDLEQWRLLVRDGFSVLYPLLINPGDRKGRLRWSLPDAEHAPLRALVLHELLRNHRGDYTRVSREVTARVLKTSVSDLLLNGIPDMDFVAASLSPEEIKITPIDGGRIRLSALISWVPVSVAGGALTHRLKMSVWPGYLTFDFTGTVEEAVDYCLLEWGRNYGMPERLDDDPGRSMLNESMHGLLGTLTGMHAVRSRQDWMQWRLNQVSSVEEKQWLLDALRSTNEVLVEVAFSSVSRWDEARIDGINEVAQRVFLNTEYQPNLRVLAIEAYNHPRPLPLIELLDDATPFTDILNDLRCVLDPSYPFFNHPFVEFSRVTLTESIAVGRIRESTVSHAALERLKQLSHRDFGTDKDAWRQHYRSTATHGTSGS